jgi:hypothetical protein
LGVAAGKDIEAFGKKRVPVAVHNIDIDLVVVKVDLTLPDQGFMSMTARAEQDLPDNVGAGVCFPSKNRSCALMC